MITGLTCHYHRTTRIKAPLGAGFSRLSWPFEVGASGQLRAGFSRACAFVFCAFLSVASAFSAWERRTDACFSLGRPSTDMSLVWGLLAGREPMSGLRGDRPVNQSDSRKQPPRNKQRGRNLPSAGCEAWLLVDLFGPVDCHTNRWVGSLLFLLTKRHMAKSINEHLHPTLIKKKREFARSHTRADLSFGLLFEREGGVQSELCGLQPTCLLP